MALEKLLELLTDLKDVEGILKIALGECNNYDLLKRATETLHNIVKDLETEYNKAIGEIR